MIGNSMLKKKIPTNATAASAFKIWFLRDRLPIKRVVDDETMREHLVIVGKIC